MAESIFSDAAAIPDAPGTRKLAPAGGAKALGSPSENLTGAPSSAANDDVKVPAPPPASTGDMVKSQVMDPDGNLLDVTHPSTATPSEIFNYVQNKFEAKPSKASQTLGFEETMMNAWDRASIALNMAAHAALGPDFIQNAMPGGFALPEGTVAKDLDAVQSAVGLAPTAQGATDVHQKHFAAQEKKTPPGEAGKFVGELVATAPIAAATENPWLVGGISGGVTGHGKDWESNAIQVAFDALTQGTLHHSIGLGATFLNKFVKKPGQAALEYVARRMKAAGKTPDDIRQFWHKVFQKPFTAAEAIGRTAMADLTALGRRSSGTVPDKLEAELDLRAINQADRFLKDFEQTTDTPTAVAKGDLDTFVEEKKEKAADLYQLADEQTPILTPQMKAWMEHPGSQALVMQGMKHGIMMDALKAAKDPLKPFDQNAYGIIGWKVVDKPIQAPTLPLLMRKTGMSRGSLDITHIEPIIGTMPKWKTWFAAIRGIDDVINRDFRDKFTGQIVGEQGRALAGLRKAISDHLKSVNEPYREASAIAGDYMEATDAFVNDAKRVFDSNVTAAQFLKATKDLSETGKTALRGGIGNVLYHMAQAGKLKPRMLETDLIQSKLRMAFGPEKTEALIERVEAEAQLAKGYRMKPGTGSTTGEVLNMTDEQNRFFNVGTQLAIALGEHTAGATHAASYRSWRAVQEFVSSFSHGGVMSEDVRNEVGRLYMMTPDQLADELEKNPARIQKLVDAIRLTQRTVGRVGGQAASHVTSQ